MHNLRKIKNKYALFLGTTDSPTTMKSTKIFPITSTESKKLYWHSSISASYNYKANTREFKSLLISYSIAETTRVDIHTTTHSDLIDDNGGNQNQNKDDKKLFTSK